MGAHTEAARARGRGPARRLAAPRGRAAGPAAAAQLTPPRTPPRTDRERLLAAALRLAARERVSLLSAAQIADEAGVPLGAFFELFDDRDDCLRAAIADAGERLLAIAQAARRERPRTAGGTARDARRDALPPRAHPLHARAVTVLAPCSGPSVPQLRGPPRSRARSDSSQPALTAKRQERPWSARCGISYAATSPTAASVGSERPPGHLTLFALAPAHRGRPRRRRAARRPLSRPSSPCAWSAVRRSR